MTDELIMVIHYIKYNISIFFLPSAKEIFTVNDSIYISDKKIFKKEKKNKLLRGKNPFLILYHLA